ncbi:thioesterase II family protein [Streptomyces sp. NBC_00838]|uniref:thioesterase II family protein n=1 Tax=Streptomyces sp. NBC_00838 TaxID=2903680 RepID=UPI003866122D|nr:thioesterase II family protein [Streptomyces sp. NBC_00838]
MTGTTDDTWIRVAHRNPGSGTRLVCLPHAGGAASYFFPMSAALAPDVEVLSVQYPGRHDRRHERPVDDLHLLADRIAEALGPWTDRPFALFGHSYGALLGYEVARRLRAAGHRPLALFVSGRRAPSTHRDERLHLKPDASLIAELKSLDGTVGALLDNEEIIAMVMPALRADYRAVETYVQRPGPELDIPVTAFIGDDDPKVTSQEAARWREHTTSDFSLEIFPGGHFYLAERRQELTSSLRRRLDEVVAHSTT